MGGEAFFVEMDAVVEKAAGVVAIGFRPLKNAGSGRDDFFLSGDDGSLPFGGGLTTRVKSGQRYAPRQFPARDLASACDGST